jgi:pyroglutamyl-peptidase
LLILISLQPFDEAGPGNLSYSVVTTLPKFLPATRSSQVPVRIVAHPYDIPVIYNEVHSLVPRLYEAYSREVDVWLHLGMRPGQDSYSIELVGHRDGYDEKDITGHTLPAIETNSFFPDCPERLEGTLDTEDVFSRWRSKLLDAPDVSPQLGSVRIRKSTDPGHFICDFLYYSVLAEHWRRKDGVDGGPRPPDLMPVMFLNVPTDNTVEQLRRARHVTICLLQAVAESWNLKREGSGNHNGDSAS